jgi:polar amino acid transport system substrate-binding protein
MIAGASITDERAADGWYFSDGYYFMTQCLAARIDEEIKSFEDLEGKTVGVKNGTLGAQYAESLKDQYGFEIKYYDGSLTMYYGVETREVEACFEDTQIMKIQIQDLELSMEIVEGSENEGSLYGFVVFSEDKQDLLDQFNTGLANIVANGTYEEIIAKYLGEEAAQKAAASLDV